MLVNKGAENTPPSPSPFPKTAGCARTPALEDAPEAPPGEANLPMTSCGYSPRQLVLETRRAARWVGSWRARVPPALEPGENRSHSCALDCPAPSSGRDHTGCRGEAAPDKQPVDRNWVAIRFGSRSPVILRVGQPLMPASQIETAAALAPQEAPDQLVVAPTAATGHPVYPMACQLTSRGPKTILHGLCGGVGGSTPPNPPANRDRAAARRMCVRAPFAGKRVSDRLMSDRRKARSGQRGAKSCSPASTPHSIPARIAACCHVPLSASQPPRSWPCLLRSRVAARAPAPGSQGTGMPATMAALLTACSAMIPLPSARGKPLMSSRCRRFCRWQADRRYPAAA